jgi:prepilin-type N-terminal cleavage/methylation domain-containing protein
MNPNTRIEMTPQRQRPRAGRRNAFTLIEVLISVALVLMLTYGIAQVFKMSTDTVGAQMAIGGFVRDHRAAVTTLTEDFRNCVNDSPLFLIDSQVAYDGTPETVNGVLTRRGFRAGFKNPLEELQNLDPNKDPTVYEENGQTLTADFNQYTDRTPRLDRLGFFARGLYRRQTASRTQVFSPTTSTEAYIWYGHTAYPGGSTYPNPSGGIDPDLRLPFMMTIPQNQYAKDRILGRMAILLGDRNSFQAADSYLSPAAPPPPHSLAPLDYFTGAFINHKDLADTTIDLWRTYANDAYAFNSNTWYWPMDDDLSTFADNSLNSPPALAANDRIWRGLCQPTLVRPINSPELSQTTSCFIPNCIQFIVEYAGDYLAQDPTTGKATDAKSKRDINTGVVTDGKTDGEIDYILETVSPGITVKRIRWYGLPRDTNGDGFINEVDVLPLADVLDFYGIRSGSGGAAEAPWEKVLPFPGFMDPAMKDPVTKNQDYRNFTVANNLSPKHFKYICAWHNDAPAMIRISLKFNDPAGRLQDGQWYEYVLTR